LEVKKLLKEQREICFKEIHELYDDGHAKSRKINWLNEKIKDEILDDILNVSEPKFD